MNPIGVSFYHWGSVSILSDSAATILEHLPASVARLDSEARFLYANARLCEMLNCPLTKILGHTCNELGMPADVWPRWMSAVKTVFETQEPREFEYLTGPTPAYDAERFVQVWMQPELNSTGVVESVLLLAVTNNKVQLLRTALQTQTDLFTAFMDHGPIHAWMISAAGKYVYANTRYLRHYALAPEALYGKTARERWPAEFAETRDQNDKKVIATNQHLEVLETAPDADGTVRTWYNVKFPFSVPDGQTYLGGIGIDMTERIRMEEERRAIDAYIRRAQRLENLALLTADVVFEFNNALTGILGNASLARDRATDLDTQLKHIEDSAHTAMNLCKKLLSWCGRGPVEFPQWDLTEFLQEIQPLLTGLLPRNVVLRFRFPSEKLFIQGDSGQLQQLFIQLISLAAMLPTPGTQSVFIRMEAWENLDRGSGTPPQNESFPAGQWVRIETRYSEVMPLEVNPTQLEAPRKPNLENELGMPAILSIVKAHKGTIATRFDTGEGSIITILLPLLLQESAERESSMPLPSARKPIILIVDDVAAIRNILRKTLERADYEVIEAESGPLAIEAYRKNPKIDLVVLDLTMPKMGGATVFRALKRIRSDVRVILSTGYVAENPLLSFGPNELAGFLRKPYHPDDLLAIVRKTLNRDSE